MLVTATIITLTTLYNTDLLVAIRHVHHCYAALPLRRCIKRCPPSVCPSLSCAFC